jgi:hypothetical protein
VHHTRTSADWAVLDALPLPLPDPALDPVLAYVVKHSDIVQALDQEMLKARGLAAGTYSLEIDGLIVSSITADQLV